MWFWEFEGRSHITAVALDASDGCVSYVGLFAAGGLTQSLFQSTVRVKTHSSHIGKLRTCTLTGKVEMLATHKWYTLL